MCHPGGFLYLLSTDGPAAENMPDECFIGTVTPNLAWFQSVGYVLDPSSIQYLLPPPCMKQIENPWFRVYCIFYILSLKKIKG